MPFYFFLIAPMSLLFSWKLAYQNIVNFVEGRNEIPEHLSINRERFESAESLDHIISASVIDFDASLRITEPLMQRRRSTKVTKTDSDLKNDFKKLVFIIVFACLSNTFMVLYPLIVPSDTEGTTLFSVG